MVGWHHRFNRHGFGWTLGDSDGQGGLAYHCSWGHKESDMTEYLKKKKKPTQDFIKIADVVPMFAIHKTWKSYCLPEIL